MVEHPPEPIDVPVVPQGLQGIGRHEVPTDSVHLWESNPIKRSTISDSRLEAWIRQKGILQPLSVVHQNGEWLCIDGNRRLRIARRLGMKTVPVQEIVGTPEEIAVILNTTSERWDGQSLGQFVAMFPDALAVVPENTRRRIEHVRDIMGAGFAEYVEHNSLTFLHVAMRVARYLGKADDRRFIKKAAYWVAKHRMTLRVPAAIIMGISTRVLNKVIENDEPIII
jgi:hypothetical protein